MSEVKHQTIIPTDWPEWLAVVSASGIWPWVKTNLQMGETVLVRYNRGKFREEWGVPFICSNICLTNLYLQKVMKGYNVWENNKLVGRIWNDGAYGKNNKKQRFIPIMGIETKGLNVIAMFGIESTETNPDSYKYDLVRLIAR